MTVIGADAKKIINSIFAVMRDNKPHVPALPKTLPSATM